MKIKVSCSVVYHTEDFFEEFVESQGDHALTLSALQDFIIDRFVSPNFDPFVKIDVEIAQ